MVNLSKYSLVALLIGLALVLGAEFFAEQVERPIDKIKSSENFAKCLDERTDRTINLIKNTQSQILAKGAKRVQLENNQFYQQIFEDEGILIAAYHNNDLVLWSHNAVSPANLKEIASKGTELYRFENGWYRLIYLTNGRDEYLGAIQIKKTFPYDNSFLDNGFRKGFDLPWLNDIHTEKVVGGVKLKADHQSFYLSFYENPTQSFFKALIHISLAIVGALLILWALFRLLLRRPKYHPVYSLAFVLVIFVLRVISLHSGWPSYVTAFDLFSPTVYASSAGWPSLADMLINSALILLSSLVLSRLFERSLKKPSTLTRVLHVLVLATLLACSMYVNYLLKGLVIHSSIPFEINSITALNAFSFVGILAMGLLYYSCFKLFDGLAKAIGSSEYTVVQLGLMLSVTALFWILVNHYLGIVDLIYVLWPIALILALFYFRIFLRVEGRNFGGIILGIVFFAALGSHSFIKYSSSREHAQRKVFAEKLAVDDDPVAEILFEDLASRLAKDPEIRNVFEENDLHSRETLQGFISSRYFNGYWSRYDVEIFAYEADSTVWGKLPSVRPKTFRDVRQKIETYGEPTELVEQLYFMFNTEDLVTYIAIVPLHYSLSEAPDGFIVIELSSKLFPQQLGFPSLLIDEGFQTTHISENYATARYAYGKLISSRGRYPYQSHPGNFDDIYESQEFLKKRGYEHLVSRVDQNTLLVLSKELKSPLDKATTLSYLCAIFGSLFVLLLAIKNIVLGRSSFTVNLNQKVQGLLVILTLTSLLLFTFATQYFIREKYTEKNQSQISEKMQSILMELGHKLGEEEQINYDMIDYLNRLLSQFSFIFFTDINIYSPDGLLLASSQMRMFNEGLISRKIHPEAYTHLRYLDQVEFINQEKVGRMAYLSGYAPFYNDRGELLAYVNLPYFAKQTELENEISSFLIAVVNVFVLLFLLSILFGLYTAQWITAPLRAIRENLQGIELGKANRLIAYSGTDEIGRLVHAYNDKVAELENNAALLAQSERESAWREMAKQVAHEIKNPLTPMKLNIQYLERSLSNGGQVDEERIEKISKQLIQQIDTLTGIANAFSNFAQMPKAQETKVDLVHLLDSAVGLYDKFEKINIHADFGSITQAFIMADKEQMLRVFNNLIKNAIQATDGQSHRVIRIDLKEFEGGYQTSVSDNGKGIALEDRQRIFMPNFTTKSGGMGLGLALSKNIVEQSGGKIWFESIGSSDTSFFVWMPKGD